MRGALNKRWSVKGGGRALSGYVFNLSGYMLKFHFLIHV
jgi:hypothetical protein